MKSTPSQFSDALNEAILLSRAACSLPPLGTSELKAVREAWSAVLAGQIPAGRVLELTTLALRGMPEGKRALGAPDVLHLWRKVRAEEADRKRVLEAKPCHACGSKLVIVIWSPDAQKNIAVPCPFHAKEQK